MSDDRCAVACEVQTGRRKRVALEVVMIVRTRPGGRAPAGRRRCMIYDWLLALSTECVGAVSVISCVFVDRQQRPLDVVMLAAQLTASSLAAINYTVLLIHAQHV